MRRAAIGLSALLYGCSVAPLAEIYDGGLKLERDGGVRDGGVRDGGPAVEDRDGGPRDAGPRDAGRDAGPPPSAFPYVPSNFVPAAASMDGWLAVGPDSECVLDTTDGRISGGCTVEGGQTSIVSIDDEHSVLLFEIGRMDVEGSLVIVGPHPALFAVYGNARISGAVFAGATGTEAGPGADAPACGTGGNGGDLVVFASGGGGGGFATEGARGGHASGMLGGGGGETNGNTEIVPLRGGCRGGFGGGDPPVRPGGGGGAVQISAAGVLSIRGVIAVPGGGGLGGGPMGLFAGAGGGSGGAILLEATELTLFGSAALFATGGAGGGGNEDSNNVAEPGQDGVNGSVDIGAARGGDGRSGGGKGGDGAFGEKVATAGEDAAQVGGGGGGGNGRIRLRADACQVSDAIVVQPLPLLDCP